MKIQNGDIWLTKEALQAAAKLPATALTARGKYFLAKLSRKLSGPLEDMETARVKLIQQHGQKTETGWVVSSGEATRKFQQGFMEILEIETEVDWTPVMLSEQDAAALTVAEIMLLDKFISFPEPTETPEPSSNGVAKDAGEVVKK